MLQQTQVNTVIPYFHRFINRFPDIHSLAKSPIEDVLTLWSGLGYYKRARQLKQSAEVISNQYDGIIPDNYLKLIKLPGIGKYTAAAILSIAYNLKYPVVDGNVIRVITRIFQIEDPIHLSNTQKYITSILNLLIPDNNPGQFNQALMELGSLICTPKNNQSKCLPCPVKSLCKANTHNLIHKLPNKIPQRQREKISQIIFILTNHSKILIQKRSEGKLLSTMWEFPYHELDNNADHNKVYSNISEALFNTQINPKYISSIKHTITYRDITCYIYQLEAQQENAITIESLFKQRNIHFQWISPHEITQFPHSSMIKKILTKIDLNNLSIF